MSADEQLRQEWDIFGRPGGYEAPGEQELRDLTDARHRKRGEKAQRKRLKRNRQLAPDGVMVLQAVLCVTVLQP